MASTMASLSLNTLFDHIKARFAGRANHAFMYALGALFLVRLVMFGLSMEQSSGYAVGPRPISLDFPIKEDSKDYLQVQAILQPWPQLRESDYYVLTQHNMFDPQVARDAEQLERRADERYQAALQAFQQGNLDRAKTLVEETLAIQLNHSRARKLREKVLAQIEAAAAQTSENEASSAR